MSKDALKSCLKAMTCFNCRCFGDGYNAWCYSDERNDHDRKNKSGADKIDSICEYFLFPEWIEISNKELTIIRAIIKEIKEEESNEN